MRASRWDVRAGTTNGTAPSYTLADLALRWGCDEGLVRTIVLGEGGFLERGFMESFDGDGRVRVADLGLRVSKRLNGVT
jgi:hypothetical protein